MASRSSHFSRGVVIRFLWSAAIISALGFCCGAQGAQGCSNTTSCGQNSVCTNQYCTCVANYFSPSGNNTDCRDSNAPDSRCQNYDKQCVFCGTRFQGPCLACAGNYYLSDKSCVDKCSVPGFQFLNASVTNLVAKACLTTQPDNSLPTWAVILIVILSFALIVLLVAIGVIACCCCYRSFNVKSFPMTPQETTSELPPISPESRFATARPVTSIPLAPTASVTRNLPPIDALEDINVMTNPDDDEKAIFLQKLRSLRPRATAFLSILNDIRRRTSRLPPQSATAAHYKSVCQDLMRLLYLLNKKPKSVVMPLDGVQLLVWAERVLEKYPKIKHEERRISRLSKIGEVDETNF